MLSQAGREPAEPRPVTAAEFSALMAPLGPFGAAPRLGLAVSGGADSLALALLAGRWVSETGGSAHAFIVDHGLRAGSASEAEETARRLARLGLPARIMKLTGLGPGPGVSERARAARHAALAGACGEAGIIHLLLGHHAADQAETLIMRRLRSSGPAGLAGMAAVTETAALRLLRPLLGLPPGRLRATLRAAGLGWAEDPTNADQRFTRARLRALRADAAGTGPATQALSVAATLFGTRRAMAERRVAEFLAQAAEIRPEGFVRLAVPGPWPAAGLAALLRMVAGAPYAPESEAVARLAAEPGLRIGQGSVLAGAHLRPAGRLGAGFLICREIASLAPPVPAHLGVVWDGRFRLGGRLPEGDFTLGALGAEAAAFRRLSDLPSLVLQALPALRDAGGRLRAVPALGWHADAESRGSSTHFAPAMPAAGAIFRAAVKAEFASAQYKA